MLKLTLIDAADAGHPMKLEDIYEAADTGLSRREVLEKIDEVEDEYDELRKEAENEDADLLKILDGLRGQIRSMRDVLIHRGKKGVRNDKE